MNIFVGTNKRNLLSLICRAEGFVFSIEEEKQTNNGSIVTYAAPLLITIGHTLMVQINSCLAPHFIIMRNDQIVKCVFEKKSNRAIFMSRNQHRFGFVIAKS